MEKYQDDSDVREWRNFLKARELDESEANCTHLGEWIQYYLDERSPSTLTALSKAYNWCSIDVVQVLSFTFFSTTCVVFFPSSVRTTSVHTEESVVRPHDVRTFFHRGGVVRPHEDRETFGVEQRFDRGFRDVRREIGGQLDSR